MDNLITFLEDKASDENLPIAIRTAAFNGLKIMKKYYALTDDSILPCCGISKSLYLICSFAYAYVLLHSSMPPCLKMVYFTRVGWSTDWIAAARKVITDLWLEHYKHDVDTNPAAAPVRYFSFCPIASLLTLIVVGSWYLCNICLLSEHGPFGANQCS